MEEGGKEGREGGSLSRKILETVVQLFDIMARLRSCFTDAPAETLTPQSMFVGFDGACGYRSLVAICLDFPLNTFQGINILQFLESPCLALFTC